MLNEVEQALSKKRSNEIDFARISDLHFLGNYVRRLPVSIERMMENAYDWEHLPFVHATTFSSIDLLDSGPWGWRAKTGLTENAGGGYQLLDLLVDQQKNYWATSIYEGSGTGIEIHTQATAIAAHEIEIDVKFYMAEKPENQASSDMAHLYLKQQYAALYDEDLALMSARQISLDDQLRWKNAIEPSNAHRVGVTSELDPEKIYVIETEKGRFCLRRWQGHWIVHSAVCPHAFGPLDESAIDKDGTLTCPWHGYQFNVETGENTDKKCKALAVPPALQEAEGVLFLQFDR